MPIFALGLGELQTFSALNQPFNAELELITKPSELDGLEVKLASEDDFARAGIERLPVLNALRFRVAKSNGRDVVRITSRQAIQEPYLNFLIEVNWSRGRLLREFTVLLDPPELLGGEAAPVEAPRAAERPMEPAPEPSRVETAPAVMPETGSVETETGGPLVYGPIVKNEKLWNIAKTMRGSQEATIPQVMMALLRNNPEAFIDNNVNRVKAGYILRIENPADIYTMSPQEARAKFQNQYQLWLDYKQQRAMAAEKRRREQEVAEYRARLRKEMNGDVPAKGEGVLTLVRPESDKPVGGHLDSAESGTGEESEEIQSLRQQLSEAEENAQLSRQENEAMHERLKSMEEQLAALQRLMEVRSDELIALQKEMVDEQRQAEGLPPKTEEEKAAEEGEGWQETLIAKFKSVLKHFQANPQMTGIIGGALFLFLTAVWLVMRRRKESDLGNYRFSQAPVESFDYEDQWTDTAELPQEEVDEWISTPKPRAELEREEMEEDPITQADIFIAYGNLDAAVEVMEEATRKWPDNGEYHRKLDELKARRGGGSAAAAAAVAASTTAVSEEPAPQVPPTPEIDLSDEEDLLTDEDLLDFEKQMESSGGEDALEDINTAMADFGFDLGEDKDLEEVGEGLSTESSAMEEGLDFDLGDIHNELEQLTAETPAEETAPAEEPIVDFDLGELADELEQVSEPEIESPAEVEEEPAAIVPEGEGDGFFEVEDHEPDLLNDVDEVGTKLDLAKAYIDMGDPEGARSILEEVLQEGSEQQINDANDLLAQIK